MKRTYVKPAIAVFELQTESPILSNSTINVNSGRSVGSNSVRSVSGWNFSDWTEAEDEE